MLSGHLEPFIDLTALQRSVEVGTSVVCSQPWSGGLRGDSWGKQHRRRCKVSSLTGSMDSMLKRLILALRGLSHLDYKLKASLYHGMRSRPLWAIWSETLSPKQTKQQQLQTHRNLNPGA